METREYTDGKGTTIIETLDEDGNVVNREIVSNGMTVIGNQNGRIKNWR